MSIRSIRKEFYGAVASWRFATCNSMLKLWEILCKEISLCLIQFFSNLFGHGNPFLHREALKCCSLIKYKYVQSSLYFAAISLSHVCDLTIDQLASFTLIPSLLLEWHPCWSLTSHFKYHQQSSWLVKNGGIWEMTKTMTPICFCCHTVTSDCVSLRMW